MIISTGGATMEDVQRAVDAITPINSQLCILQCTAAYPCDADKMNLRVIETFRNLYPEFVIGLSDHQDGIAMSMLAYAFGARVFEKHFTLHRSWKGSDQAFSLEPSGLGRMVRDLRRAHHARGDGVKAPLPEEIKPIEKMSKKVVPARCLVAGHVLTESDLAFKSPGGGIPPYEIEKLLGRALKVPVEMDEELKWEHLV
jgi:N-acetylneuraminate synthase/sialic acid synthase